jgi:hypothetical protein
MGVVQSSEARMNAILEDKRYSSNTFIEIIITLCDCFGKKIV